MSKKLLSLGLSDFRALIKSNHIYVDKTKWIYELVKPPKGLYFLFPSEEIEIVDFVKESINAFEEDNWDEYRYGETADR